MEKNQASTWSLTACRVWLFCSTLYKPEQTLPQSTTTIIISKFLHDGKCTDMNCWQVWNLRTRLAQHVTEGATSDPVTLLFADWNLIASLCHMTKRASSLVHRPHLTDLHENETRLFSWTHTETPLFSTTHILAIACWVLCQLSQHWLLYWFQPSLL